MKAVILDTSAFIQGFNTSDSNTQLYTTPNVINEFKEEITKIRASNWSQTGKLVIMSPRETVIEQVIALAKKVGDIKNISTTDISIIALTQQLKQDGLTTVLLSDDYSVQNIADHMGLTYRGMITHGIIQRIHWINYCPGCRKQFNKNQYIKICPICGTEIKRKPGQKTKIGEE